MNTKTLSEKKALGLAIANLVISVPLLVVLIPLIGFGVPGGVILGLLVLVVLALWSIKLYLFAIRKMLAQEGNATTLFCTGLFVQVPLMLLAVALREFSPLTILAMVGFSRVFVMALNDGFRFVAAILPIAMLCIVWIRNVLNGAARLSTKKLLIGISVLSLIGIGSVAVIKHKHYDSKLGIFSAVMGKQMSIMTNLEQMVHFCEGFGDGIAYDEVYGSFPKSDLCYVNAVRKANDTRGYTRDELLKVCERVKSGKKQNCIYNATGKWPHEMRN